MRPVGKNRKNSSANGDLAGCAGVAGHGGGAKPLRFRAAAAIGVVLLAALAADVSRARAQAEEGAVSGGSPLERFKQFISSPPIISNLVFQQKVPMGSGMRPLDGTFALSTSFEYFQARWQTNGLLFRRLGTLSDATNLSVVGPLVSWSGHQKALFEPVPQLTTWDDRDPSAAGKQLSVFYTSHFVLDPLRKILNLGVMYAETAAIRWEGNRFSTECDVDHEHLRISGEVVPSAGGRADHLRVKYEFPRQTYQYVVRYGYSPPLPYSFLPTVITNFWLENAGKPRQREVDLDEWQILALRFADRPLAPEAFAVEPYAQGHKWPIALYTNGGFYARMTNGTLRLVGELEPRILRPTAASRRRLAMFYGAWAGLNIGIFALMLSVRAGQQENRNNKPKKGIADEEV